MSNMIEMPGGPRLDHYYGRGIDGIVEGEEGKDECFWYFILSGDVILRNYDEDVPMPGNEMTGMQLVGAIFSETETRMLFKLGTEKEETITLNPTKYSIADPNVVGGESFPQRPPEMEEDEAIEINDEDDIVLDSRAAESDSDERDDEGEEDGR